MITKKDLKEYEEICPECHGKMFIDNPVCLKCMKEGGDKWDENICDSCGRMPKLVCNTCCARGKITWIDKIKGKKQ